MSKIEREQTLGTAHRCVQARHCAFGERYYEDLLVDGYRGTSEFCDVLAAISKRSKVPLPFGMLGGEHRANSSWLPGAQNYRSVPKYQPRIGAGSSRDVLAVSLRS